MLFKAANDPCSFVLRIKATVYRDRQSTRLIRPKLLRLAATIVGDHTVRGVKNGLCGAIVLLKGDHLCLRPVALKVQDVADVCTTP